MIDYDYTSISLKSVFNILRNKFEKNSLNKIKFTNIKKGEPLFIYITGHGYLFFYSLEGIHTLRLDKEKQLSMKILRICLKI